MMFSAGDDGPGKWINDGGPGCLRPLATAIEKMTAADGDRDMYRTPSYEASLEPMKAARGMFARATGREDVPTDFTEDSLPWGMLMLASDNAAPAEWAEQLGIEEDGEPPTRRTTLMHRTMDSITTWLHQTLGPGQARWIEGRPPLREYTF